MDHPVEQVSGVSFVLKVGVLVCHRGRRSMGERRLATISDQVDAYQLTEMSSLVSGKVLKEGRKGRWDFQSVSGSGCYRCEVLKGSETEEGTLYLASSPPLR